MSTTLKSVIFSSDGPEHVFTLSSTLSYVSAIFQFSLYCLFFLLCFPPPHKGAEITLTFLLHTAVRLA